MRYRKIILVLAFVLGLPHPALAHPHIFVRYDVTIAPAERGSLKLHFTFKINALANPLLTPGVEAPDNPQLKQDMLANLAAHPFYIYLDIDGQSMGRQEVRPVASGHKDAYVFDLTLPDTNGSLSFALYDPEYFVSVSQSGADSVKAAMNKMICTVEEQKVGKTVWGVIRAQYVECEGKTGKKPAAHAQQPPEDISPDEQGNMNGRNFLP